MVPPAATPAEDEGDLCDLFTKAASPPTAEQLANLLRGRFLSDIPYTSIGYSSLVAINPYKQVQANIDSALYEYTAEGWDLPVPGQPRSEALPPHVRGI
jgi:chitin synthase